MKGYVLPTKSHSYQMMAWLAVILLVFNVYHTKILDILGLYASSVTLIIQSVAVLLLVLYIAMEKKIGLLSVEIHPMEWCLILTLAVMLITTEDYAGNMTYILRYGVLVLIVILMKYDEKLIHILFICIAAASAIHILATLWFYYDTDFYMEYIFPHFTATQRERLYGWVQINRFAVGLSSHYSQNGLYMALGLCCCYPLFYMKGKLTLPAEAAIFSVALFALILTGKRGALLFGVAAVIISYVLCRKGAASGKFVAAILIAAGGMLLTYILSFYVETVAETLGRFAVLFSDNPSVDVSNGRFKLYNIAWDFFCKSPVFGIGWREFSKEVVNQYNQDGLLRDTHNVFLQLLCETGLVGFCVFLSLFVSSTVLTVRLILVGVRRQLNLSEMTKGALVFSACYQIFFLLYCMTGNPLYDLETLYAYVISVGISSGVYYRYREDLMHPKPQNLRVSKYIRQG